jgi:hypothetical protein
MDEDDMIKTTNDFLVTETALDPKLAVDRVVTALRKRKTTGQLVFHLSQGGVQKIALVEKTKTVSQEKEKIREILGWE